MKVFADATIRRGTKQRVATLLRLGGYQPMTDFHSGANRSEDPGRYSAGDAIPQSRMPGARRCKPAQISS